MDALLQILEPTANRNGPINSVYVDLDRKTGKLWQRGVLSKLSPDRRTWRVMPDRTVKLPADTVQIEIRNEGRPLEIGFRCDVTIVKTDVVAAVEALCEDERPGVALKRWIADWFSRWAAESGQPSHAEATLRLTREKDRIEQKIAEEGGRELHLRLRVYLEISASGFGDIRIATGVIRVKPRDVQTEYSIQATATLVVGGGMIAPGGPAMDADWTREVAETLRRSFDLKISLWETLFEHERVSDRLRADLEAQMMRWGRSVGGFTVVLPTPSFERETTVQTSVPWASPSGKVVNMRLTVKMSADPAGIARYEAAGRPDLTEWVRRKAPGSLANNLHDRDYIHLDPRVLANLEKAIERDLSVEATAIGHLVSAVLSEPDLPIQKWRRGVRVVCPQREYASAQPVFVADVDLSLEVHTDQLNLLKPLFDRDADVVAEVARTTTAAAEAFFRSIQPLDYLQFFEQAEIDAGPAKTPSVRDRLEAAIGRALKKTHGLELASFTSSRHDTRLNGILKGLIQKKNQKVEFSVAMRSVRGDRLTMPSELFFDVDAWIQDHRIIGILTREFDLARAGEEIRLFVEDAIERFDPREIAAFVNAPEQAARQQHHEFREKLKGLVEAYMADKFGLVIDVKSIRIDATEEVQKEARDAEVKSAKARIQHFTTRNETLAAELQALKADKAKYADRRTKAYETGDHEELRQLEIFKKDIAAREEELRERGAGGALPTGRTGRDVTVAQSAPPPAAGTGPSPADDDL